MGHTCSMFSLKLIVCVCVLFSIGIKAAPGPKPWCPYWGCYNREPVTVSPWVYYNRAPVTVSPWYTTTEVVKVPTQDATMENPFAVTGVEMALIVDATVNLRDYFMENIEIQFF